MRSAPKGGDRASLLDGPSETPACAGRSWSSVMGRRRERSDRLGGPRGAHSAACACGAMAAGAQHPKLIAPYRRTPCGGPESGHQAHWTRTPSALPAGAPGR
jgi:hypothetical protein